MMRSIQEYLLIFIVNLIIIILTGSGEFFTLKMLIKNVIDFVNKIVQFLGFFYNFLVNI